MTQLNCPSCKAVTQGDGPIPACPLCNTPNPNVVSSAPAIPDPSPKIETAAVQASAPAAPSAPAAAPAAPAAPTETLAQKIEAAAEKILGLVAADAPAVGTMFGSTSPIGAILKVLGPTAAIGAAVLHQHLTTQGFDLSQLQQIDTVK